jgi:small subunit ribosomal protein S9
MSIIHISGKRKKAIARATLRPGKGIVTVNNVHIEDWPNAITKLKMREPMILAGETANKVNISVRVQGGGTMSQAMAVRLAIAKALAGFEDSLRSVFLEYDRKLLVADVRRNEPTKPNSHGKPRAKVQKSYR